MSSTLTLTDFSMFPLEPRGKRPLVSDWTTRTFDIEKYRNLTGNFAVKADDTFCILESDDYERLKNELGQTLPVTYTVQARPNRPHFYFRQTPATVAAGNLDVPGLYEFKQHNRYVVAEGSIHPSGAEYLCTADAAIAVMPDWLISKLIELRRSAPPRDMASEGRHPAIMNWCGKNFRGAGVDDEGFRQGAINFDAENNHPCRGWRHAAECAQWYIDEDKTPNNTGPKVLLGEAKMDAPEEPCTGNDYVVGSAPGQFEGWFPLGEVSLLAGSSGAGKTTFGLQLLTAQARGEDFFGRDTFSRPYIIVMRDRSPFALKRTFRRMNLDQTTLPFRLLHTADYKKGPALVLEDLYKAEYLKPRVIFLEGLDIWIPDSLKMEVVAPILEQMQSVATRYNFAIIATMGSPKMNKNNKYESPRDGVFGSQVFSRMTETIVRVNEDYDTGIRELTIMPRNSPQEKFELIFEDGKLVRQEKGIETGLEEDIQVWFKNNPTANSTQVMAHFGVGRTKACDILRSKTQ